MSAAAELMERLDGPDAASISLEWSEELPDVLHALCRGIQQRGDASDVGLFEVASTVYELIERFSWSADSLKEKSEILASVAFVAWNACRRSGDYRQMVIFEARCERHVLRCEDLRAFLSLPFAQRTPRLRSRFLSDPAVLLATLAQMTVRADSSPGIVAMEMPQLHEWVLTEGSGGRSAEEAAFFAGKAALIASGAFRHLGNFREASRWLGLADGAFAKTVNSTAMRAMTEYSRLAILYETGHYSEALSDLERQIETFRALGMLREAAKAEYLEAVVLKTVGSSLATDRFTRLTQSEEIRCSALLHGLCLANLGELDAREGRLALAVQRLGAAKPLLHLARASFGLAYLHGVVGEVLRDTGQLADAIDAYRSAVTTYLDGEFSCQAAYMRIVLAETLLAAGRDAEAVSELLAALPVIERESLGREGVAAIALLRASLRRAGTDRDALRRLREELDRPRRGGGL